ncbi:hypothetical protein Ddc_14792 [Ditylenchus destructor]|nr:hypothetical protein Ddc_14792 [Ditylenchus destructor]
MEASVCVPSKSCGQDPTWIDIEIGDQRKWWEDRNVRDGVLGSSTLASRGLTLRHSAEINEDIIENKTPLKRHRAKSIRQ